VERRECDIYGTKKSKSESKKMSKSICMIVPAGGNLVNKTGLPLCRAICDYVGVDVHLNEAKGDFLVLLYDGFYFLNDKEKKLQLFRA